MRIYALPLTRVRPNGGPAFVYYLAHMPQRARAQKAKPESKWVTTLTKGAVKKVVETWNKWGTMDSGWQRRVYEFGQRAQSRIEFEELALRSIDPTLGPRVGSSSEGAKMLNGIDGSSTANMRNVSLLYPSNFRNIVHGDPLAHLENHLSHHGSKHYRRFWIYVAITPLTVPFTLVPVIPNLPFFFVAWRAWSNYRAYKASDYLRSLIAARAIEPEASSILTEYYTTRPLPPPSSHDDSTPLLLAAGTPSSVLLSDTQPTNEKDMGTRKSAFDAPPIESDLLLRERTIQELITALELPKETRAELVNAVRQVRARLGLPKRL